MMTQHEEFVKAYELTDESAVVDVGGYYGNFSLDVLNSYSPKCVHLFEPVPDFMEKCKTALEEWTQVIYHPYAIGDEDGEATLTVNKDSTSMYCDGPGEPLAVKTISVQSFVGLIPGQVDLMGLNAEGAEFIILEHLISTGKIQGFKHMWIQFHDTVPDHLERYNALQDSLRQTHDLGFDMESIWREWRIK